MAMSLGTEYAKLSDKPASDNPPSWALGIALVNATRRGDVEAVTELVARGAPMEFQTPAQDGGKSSLPSALMHGAASALHHASSLGRVDVMKFLIDCGELSVCSNVNT